MVEVDLEACSALACIVEANTADLAIHPDAPLSEPANEVDGRDDEGVDGLEGGGEVQVQEEIGGGLEDGEEGHEEGVDDDFASENVSAESHPLGT